jgi:transposase-like protein
MPRTYDREFKLEAVRMAAEPGVTAKEVEKRLGIGSQGPGFGVQGDPRGQAP